MKRTTDWIGEYWCQPAKGEPSWLSRAGWITNKIKWGIIKWAVVPHEGYVCDSNCVVEGWII